MPANLTRLNVQVTVRGNTSSQAGQSNQATVVTRQNKQVTVTLRQVQTSVIYAGSPSGGGGSSGYFPQGWN